MTVTRTRTELVASASRAAGAAATRGRLDASGANCYGGILTFAITNGGTGPTLQCEARVMIAHKDSAMPAAGAEGTGAGSWKQVWAMGGGTAINAKTRSTYEFGPEVSYVQIEFEGNTGQAVTVECIGTLWEQT